MENLKFVFSFIGKNILIFVKSVLINFVVYMTAIAVCIIYLFSNARNFEDKISIILLLIFVLLLDYIFRKKICLKNRISILIKFTEEYLKINSKEKRDKKILEWKNIRKKIKSGSENRILKFFTEKYTDSIGVYTVVANSDYSDMEQSRKSFSILNLNNVFTELFVNLIFALPFFGISIIFTSGYRFEFMMFTLILALIFVLFIRSALISPIFLLLTHKKIFDVNNGSKLSEN